jgi:hypothetical protein
MKSIYLYILIAFTTISYGQLNPVEGNDYPFKSGEFLKFNLSYSGWLKAGEATVEVFDTSKNEKEAFHVVGKGKTTGAISWFFNVEDNYQTKFFKENAKPYYFRRRVDEGGHIKKIDIYFDQEEQTALVKDLKRNTEKTYEINNVYDMMSSFYYLRTIDFSEYKDGDEVVINMFFDAETFKFKLKLLKREEIRTKFGKVNTIKFRPLVQSGRVFKEEESLSVWVSDDKNKIPLLIKADLAVGSLRAKLVEYKGLSHIF